MRALQSDCGASGGDAEPVAGYYKRGAILTDADIISIHNRLSRLAFTKLRDMERAQELATETLIRCLEMVKEGNPDALKWHYASVALLNGWKIQLRNNSRREINLPNKPDDEIEQLRKLVTQPNQATSSMASDAVRGISLLPEKSQQVMYLVALEYTHDEIVEKLGMQKKEVYWRIRVSREILKSKGYWEPPRKGQYHWIGIRKQCRKWSATIAVEGKKIWLGNFDSASIAAKAYDDAAKHHFGAKAKLNFPETEAQLIAAISESD